ncbi:hypothetical protein F8388_001017 [Cannabis sativa]|uniref:UDP-galactose/UDP-glucose transporter 3 n=3 Tax=Cannabis sativa TaxID=3483 RepID=A0A7J6FZM9_CANSA|nr:hypothetical protein F8388_001017 [Cannabis sativa]KAF4391871.1 hypothetical protein G4B88_011514 [Cannabis sativa]
MPRSSQSELVTDLSGVFTPFAVINKAPNTYATYPPQGPTFPAASTFQIHTPLPSSHSHIPMPIVTPYANQRTGKENLSPNRFSKRLSDGPNLRQTLKRCRGSPSAAEMEAHGSGLRRILVLAFCVTGIWSAYIYQGVLQETLSTKRFGPDGKRFEHLSFLNLAQNVVCLIWSYIMIKLWSSGSRGGAPWWTFWSAGITNTIGPAMGIEALKYISYPAQVLAKSSKMIPVMLMGTLVYGIRYTFPEYLCTLLVAGGVSVFALLKTSSKTISKLAHPNAPLGYGLCFLNLAFDGFTNATQDSINARYPKTSAWDIMLGMNLWGTIYNLVYMFGWPQAIGFEAVQFCKQHPEAAWDIFLYCLCGAVGQNFIFLTISRFGSLANTTITTTRKFVSIVVSSLLSGNPLSSKQWGCVAMVFSGLSYQIYLKWRKLQRVQKKRKPM